MTGQTQIQAIITNIEKVMIGKKDVAELAVIALLQMDMYFWKMYLE